MASSLTTVPGKLLTVFFVTHYSDAKTIPPGMVFYWMA